MNKDNIMDNLDKVSCFLSLVSCLDEHDVDMESLTRLALHYKEVVDSISEELDHKEILNNMR